MSDSLVYRIKYTSEFKKNYKKLKKKGKDLNKLKLVVSKLAIIIIC